MSELCHVVTKGTTPTTLGKPFVESGIIFIKAESILADHSLDKSKFAFIDEETNALLKRSVIHAGDIVFTIAGTLGRFALIDDNALPANTNQAVAIIRADAEKVLPEYIYTCFVLAILCLERLRLVVAFDPTTVNPEVVSIFSFFFGPIVLSIVIGLTAFLLSKKNAVVTI